MKSKIVDVIIPSKTKLDLKPMVEKTIWSLRESETDYKFNVVLVESCFTHQFDVGQNKTIMYDKPDFCYNRALNLGIAATSNDWVVLANNDLVFFEGWFSKIIEASSFYPDFKSFSPWNNMHDWHNRLFPDNRINLIPGYRICYEMTGWCIVVKRSVLETIGLLSERCKLWYSDNIYADALIKNGILHGLVASSYVDHITSQTIDFTSYVTNEDRIKYLAGLEQPNEI